MSRRTALALLTGTLTLAACRGDPLPACRVASKTDLQRNPLTLLKQVTLLRAGNGFVLAGVDKDQVLWARLGADGKLETTSLTLPTPRVVRPAPWLAVVGKAAAGDQLVAFSVVAKGGAPGEHELVAVTQEAGGAPSSPRSVLDLEKGVALTSVRVATATSASGQSAVVVVGYEGKPIVPTALVLGGDAAVVKAAPLFGADGLSSWTCLAAGEGRAGGMQVSLVAPASKGNPNWHVFELRDDGSRGTQGVMGFHVAKLDCPVVAPTKLGYVLAFQNDNGVFFSEFELERSPAVVTTGFIAGAVRFGGAHRQPRVAAVAAMGREFGLLFERSTGHEAWRFDAFAVPQGKSLYLPSVAGSVGPVSAWGTVDGYHATYLDEIDQSLGNSSGNQRYLIKVDCPTAQPIEFKADGGDAGGAGDAGNKD